MKCYLDVVNIKGILFSGYIKKIHLTSIIGELDIYAGHAPLLAAIKFGPLCIVKEDNQKEYIYLSGGILEVQPNIINILSKKAILGSDLNKHEILKQQKIIEQCFISGNLCQTIMNLKIKLAKIISKLKTIEMMKS
ncbi:ATP synthase epsilon chain [Buchnera aphidicola (Phyllaphis fagi)]|uniref:ATP synthase F1 subunit epsilon n=1 Tax=Buchnera aphidicola TaxID=9 RepID=UPI00346446E8